MILIGLRWRATTYMVSYHNNRLWRILRTTGGNQQAYECTLTSVLPYVMIFVRSHKTVGSLVMFTPAIMATHETSPFFLECYLLLQTPLVLMWLASCCSYNVTDLFIVYMKLLHPFNLHSKVYMHYCERVRELLKVILYELNRVKI